MSAARMQQARFGILLAALEEEFVEEKGQVQRTLSSLRSQLERLRAAQREQQLQRANAPARADEEAALRVTQSCLAVELRAGEIARSRQAAGRATEKSA